MDGIVKISCAETLVPLVGPARYKGIHGGRGSGKSHFFATMLVQHCILNKGTRAVCIREVQKTLKESAKRLIEDKIESLGVGHLFRVQNEQIHTPGDGVIIFTGMKDHTKESVKSLEGFNICWVEEAQTLSQGSLDMLRPTIRAEGSEIWFSWNPRRKKDPIDLLLRGDEPPTNAIVVQANWDSNPWFPDVLEEERQETLRSDPDMYGHIWEGEYVTIVDGAYYAKHLKASRKEQRLGGLNVAADPNLPVRAFFDIGGTGAKSDARAIWIAQFVGKEVRLINYRESQGQPLAADIAWLRDNDYEHVRVVLPHDGATQDRVYAVSYESALRDAGFNVEVIPNQGRGAASKRVEAARRMFPSCWFDRKTEPGGIEALSWYHEKKDEERDIGLGPEHDWSSHAADAFGLIAVAWERMAADQNRRPAKIKLTPRH